MQTPFRKIPRRFSTVEPCIDALLEKAGKQIVLGLPLGIGKANHFANALYARAAADPSISLTIFTALTLERPRGTAIYCAVLSSLCWIVSTVSIRISRTLPLAAGNSCRAISR
ncbi:hypothetical protein [Microbulbifer spongiae]|uniref:Uncharacterized protein n=1 Tax=Microbulbifer spongiae TaxID=2944933 RepID=A0ABY9E630_9GAMM|nr:hypothetical protein [Microbulbifer sp. MI-G]WKD48480.1 hypothetical protein M8T91_11140 [Microbulbifer sp. MI-G]